MYMYMCIVDVFFIAADYESEIKKAILKDRPYDRSTRPPTSHNSAVVTSITLLLRSFQIVSILPASCNELTTDGGR